jgi:hypothetical protein
VPGTSTNRREKVVPPSSEASTVKLCLAVSLKGPLNRSVES